MFRARPSQEQILRYTGGRMAVSAVPGAGKTHTLSALTAQLVESGLVADDQEVLIVTLVNSAVDNFSQRVEKFMAEKRLPVDFGYRVRTLHGLAHDIVRERPDLAGLPNQFVIADERDSDEVLKNIALNWQRLHPEVIQQLTSPDIDPSRTSRLMQDWSYLVISLAKNFIRSAKDLQMTPEDLEERYRRLALDYPLLEMGIETYSAYQRALNYRSALDFDDLVRLALRALKSDPEYLQRLRHRWPYILEDEAQDSSRLQQEILSLLAGPDGNWVRVGDPNQAIYETFTTASPAHFLEFKNSPGVTDIPLPESGRSTLSIMRLANELVAWTIEEHPNPALRNALSFSKIEPTLAGDSQPNPLDQPRSIVLHTPALQPAEEIQLIVRSLKKWLPEHADQTAAVLVPRNKRGAEVAEELRNAGIEPLELLQSSLSARQAARLLSAILDCLGEPASAAKLAHAMQQLYILAETDAGVLKTSVELLRKCVRIEEFLWPVPDRDWLAAEATLGASSQAIDLLASFRELARKWQRSTLLPIDQLVLTVAQDIFSDTADLALAHQIALALEQAAQLHPDWRLPEFTEELQHISRNERRFFSVDEGTDFDPDQHKGRVVIATIHKAKGLEWDRVYLLSANNYDFPSGEDGDQYISERWFVRDHLNLEAETLARLDALVAGDLPGVSLEDGHATLEARLDYSRERLRLLYVGITRAKKELFITWNTGQRNDCKPAVAFEHLHAYWEEMLHALDV